MRLESDSKVVLSELTEVHRERYKSMRIKDDINFHMKDDNEIIHLSLNTFSPVKSFIIS
jgi:hypothetical protein